MNLKSLLAGLALGAGAAVMSHAATVTATVDITASGAGSVGYVGFTVTQAGRFDIYTDGPTIDPVLYLFEDPNSNGVVEASESLLDDDDDGCMSSLSFCNRAGAYDNSLIIETLAVGSYVLAVSDFLFTDLEARSGLNTNDRTGSVALSISGDRYGTNGGQAEITTAPVPLPAAGVLLLAGLGGLAAFGRRKP